MEKKEATAEESYKNYLRFRNGILWLTVCVTMSIGTILMIFHKMAVAQGLILGSFFSVINFILMACFITSSLGRSHRGASVASLKSLLLRLSIISIPVVLALKTPFFNVVAVVVGIFSVQLMTLFYFTVLRPLLAGER